MVEPNHPEPTVRPRPTPLARLLAVDLGLRTGLALFGEGGELLEYRSAHFGTVARLKAALWDLLQEAGPPAHLVLEGDRQLARHWSRPAERLGARVVLVAPEVWREELLYPRLRRTGRDAKQAACELATELARHFGRAPSTALGHDVAEAICIGLWGARQLGWTTRLPPGLL